MTAEEIIEGSKLIAEFMGFIRKQGALEHYSVPKGQELHYKAFTLALKNMPYNTSWEWLMPVIEKIESLGYKVTIEGFCCVIYKQYGEPVAYCSNFDTKINAAYYAVTAFVNWHKNHTE